MGRIYLLPLEELESIPNWSAGGPDLLDPALTEDVWLERIRKYRGRIKNILTKAEFVQGVGNAYSDEILWEARINPFTARKDLDEEDLRRLFASAREVMAWATPLARERMVKGDSLDYRERRDFFRVHRLGGEALCPRDGREDHRHRREQEGDELLPHLPARRPHLLVGGRDRIRAGASTLPDGMEPESRYVDSQRLRLHYVVWGDDGKPPLVLLHGGRDHARSWDRTALALCDRYQVFAPDLRGHGDSDWALGGNYSIIDYALDLHAVVGEIGRTPVTLVAHSLGGSIALQYAGTMPESVRGVVSIEGLGRLQSTGSEHRPAHRRMRDWLADMRELAGRAVRIYPTFEDAVTRMREANSHLSPELARHLTVHGVREVEDGYVWKFDNHMRSRSPYEFNMEDARDIWNQIRAPVLFIQGAESWGKQDTGADYSAFHTYRAETVDGAGHWVHHDRFDRFLELVEDFLAETSG